MKTRIIFTLLLLIQLLGQAQQTRNISGRIFDKDRTPTENGYNIILLLPEDSSLYKGDYFLDADFSIETDQLPVLLKVISLGYQDTTIFISDTTKDLPDIYLIPQSYALNEVVVKASRPMFNIKNDHMTLNVAGTALSEAGSAIDVLQKAARVRVEESSISVLGVGNALIVIDGRELPGNQALEMLSSSEIQKIDIITNPSSKYDAKGKAVIEIRTKKAMNQGFGAEITGRMSKGEYWNQYIGTEMTAKSKKLALYAFYAFSPTKKLHKEAYTRDYTNENPPLYGLIDMKSKNKTKENHRIRLSGDYTFSDRHKAGLQFSSQFVSGNQYKNELSRMYTSTNIQTTPISKITTFQQTSSQKNYLTGTGFYSFQSSPTGMHIDAVLDKSLYETSSKAQIHESGYSNTVIKQNNLKTIINITSFKADASIPMPNGYNLDAGIKYTNIRNRSNTDLSTENSVINKVNYNYKENTGALYFILSKQFGKLNAELGARMEISGNDATTDRVVQDTTAWNFFPSLSLNYSLSKDLETNFSYAMKISRPTFQDLNPAIEYIDSLTYFQGNPELIPEIRHSATIKLVYRKMASLGISYTRKNNLLAWYALQDPSNPTLTQVTQKNIDKSDILSVDAMLPYQNKRISCYLSTGLIYTISNDETSGVTNLKRPMWYAYSGFDLSLPYGIKFNTNIRYFTKGIENIFYFDPVFRLDIGIRKAFLNDKLIANIMWNDIFKTDDMNTYTTINNRYIGYNYYFDRSTLSFSLSYRFNTQKSKYRSRSSIGTEKQRIKNFDQ